MVLTKEVQASLQTKMEQEFIGNVLEIIDKEAQKYIAKVVRVYSGFGRRRKADYPDMVVARDSMRRGIDGLIDKMAANYMEEPEAVSRFAKLRETLNDAKYSYVLLAHGTGVSIGKKTSLMRRIGWAAVGIAAGVAGGEGLIALTVPASEMSEAPGWFRYAVDSASVVIGFCMQWSITDRYSRDVKKSEERTYRSLTADLDRKVRDSFIANTALKQRMGGLQ